MFENNICMHTFIFILDLQFCKYFGLPFHSAKENPKRMRKEVCTHWPMIFKKSLVNPQLHRAAR